MDALEAVPEAQDEEPTERIELPYPSKNPLVAAFWRLGMQTEREES